MRLVALFTFAALAMSASACGSDSSRPEGAFDATAAMAEIQYLAEEVGPRPAGSAEASAASRYISDQLSLPGFGVFFSTFTIDLEPHRPAAVRAGSIAYPAATARGSGVATITASSVEAGQGEPASLTAARGKIAVVSRGGSSFAEKAEAAAAAGAVGLIAVDAGASELLADLGKPVSIPVVTASGDAARGLLAAARAGSEMTLEVRPGATAEGRNVVARANTAHDCLYVLVANYDSLPGSPGANENAAGVAALIEVARQFSLLKPVPPVCFMALDGTYAGSLGAKRFIEPLPDSVLPAVAILLDRIGSGPDLAFSGDSFLEADALRIADSLGVETDEASEGEPAVSDAGAFRDRSVPTLVIRREGERQSPDDPASLDAEQVREAGLVAAELLLELSATREPE